MEHSAFPYAFCARMKRLLGEDYPDFLAAMEKERSYGLRVSPLKTSPAAFAARSPFPLRPIPWAAEGFYYDPSDRPGKHPYYEAGVYYIQEPSAMAVGALADAKPGERVLDLCAAPGGKTTHLAGRMNGRGLLVANEIVPSRAKILSQSVERAGIVNCIVTSESPARLAERFRDYFDCIVVDAPCSGEGMFRKEEIAVSEWTPDSPALCAERQDGILAEAAKMLRPGGRLVYSTCTFAPEENEGTLTRFLASHPDFSIIPVAGDDAFMPGRPDWYENAHPDVKYAFRLFPHRLNGEGHFVAVLRRNGDGAQSEIAPAPLLPAKKIPREFSDFARDILRDVDLDRLALNGSTLWQLPKDAPDLSGLRVLRTGLQLGEVKKGRFEPAHALALGLRTGQCRATLDLPADNDAVLAYLRGETLPCTEKGWVLVTVDGWPLGWGKASGGVLKNHYPKGLRRVK